MSRVGVESKLAEPPTTFDDFTESAYAALVKLARERFAFEPFGTNARGARVLWRHDVDISVHRALALARIEADLGVRATYFFTLHSAFYNLLEPAVAARTRELLALGHWLGLHFDVAAHDGDLEQHADAERRLLEGWLEHPVTAVSLHNPDTHSAPRLRDEQLAGLPNAYAQALEDRYLYVSDSNGYWRYRRLDDVLTARDVERVHALTHPEWWPPEPMSPRARLERAADGRARSVLAASDAELARYGRTNLR